MKLLAQNRVAVRSLSRRERKARYGIRVVLMLAVLLVGAVSVLLDTISPRSRPLVTIYADANCDGCLRWMRHLAARGFQTQLGSAADWPAVRAELGVSSDLHSALTAEVDGLLIEGPVPARDIHRALQLRSSYDVRALIVSGMPRGSPGSDSSLPQRYIVFVVRSGGRVHEFAEHEQ